MFFEKEIISFNLLDVLYIDQKNVNMFNSGRNFNALSFRFSADTRLKTEKEELHLTDNFLTFVPARLDYSRIAIQDSLICIHFEATSFSGKNIEAFEAKEPDIFSGLFREIYDLWEKKDIGYQMKCTAILYRIFAECYIQNYKIYKGVSKIQPSVDYINENYKKSELSIKEAARKSFMSEVYFRKLFKKDYGISPQKYIVNLRIQNAAGLISTGYYSLKEVAFLSGYNDYKYFSVEFKKAVGVSPSEYQYKF